jgi:hypothetical protein
VRKKSNAALQRPGDNCISGKLSMRGTLIPVRCKRLLGAVSRSFGLPVITVFLRISNAFHKHNSISFDQIPFPILVVKADKKLLTDLMTFQH